MNERNGREANTASEDIEGHHAEATPPAGPHDKEELIDREKTPGTGSLPDAGEPEADVGPD